MCGGVRLHHRGLPWLFNLLLFSSVNDAPWPACFCYNLLFPFIPSLVWGAEISLGGRSAAPPSHEIKGGDANAVRCGGGDGGGGFLAPSPPPPPACPACLSILRGGVVFLVDRAWCTSAVCCCMPAMRRRAGKRVLPSCFFMCRVPGRSPCGEGEKPGAVVFQRICWQHAIFDPPRQASHPRWLCSVGKSSSTGLTPLEEHAAAPRLTSEVGAQRMQSPASLPEPQTGGRPLRREGARGSQAYTVSPSLCAAVQQEVSFQVGGKQSVATRDAGMALEPDAALEADDVAVGESRRYLAADCPRQGVRPSPGRPPLAVETGVMKTTRVRLGIASPPSPGRPTIQTWTRPLSSFRATKPRTTNAHRSLSRRRNAICWSSSSRRRNDHSIY